LVKEEFYVAMRLVALMQSDKPATENAINLNVEAPLPRFEDYKPGTPGAPSHTSSRSSEPSMSGASQMRPPQPMQNGGGGFNVDSLPDLDTLDFGAP
jgi:hypothetical protein